MQQLMQKYKRNLNLSDSNHIVYEGTKMGFVSADLTDIRMKERNQNYSDESFVASKVNNKNSRNAGRIRQFQLRTNGHNYLLM